MTSYKNTRDNSTLAGVGFKDGDDLTTANGSRWVYQNEQWHPVTFGGSPAIQSLAVTTNSSGVIRLSDGKRRLSLDRRRMTFTTRRIDALDATTGWAAASGNTATGTLSAVAASGPRGETALKISAVGAGTRQYEKSIAVPSSTLRKGYIGLSIMSPDWSKVKNLILMIFTGAGSTYYQYFGKPHVGDIVQWSGGYDDRIDGEWRLRMLSGMEMSTAGGAGPWLTDTSDAVKFRIGVEFLDAGGELYVSELLVGAQCTKPVLCFSFDDSNLSDYTEGYKILSRYGYRATTFTIRDAVGKNNQLTLDHLGRLADAGWTIGVHGNYSHIDTLRDDYQAIYDDVAYNQDLVVSNGFGDGRSYAYPEGDYGPNSIRALRSLGFRYAGTVAASNYPPLPGFNPLIYPRAGTSGKTLAVLQAEVDALIASMGMRDNFTHGLWAGASGIHTDAAIFAGLCEYASEKEAGGLLEVGNPRDQYVTAVV